MRVSNTNPVCPTSQLLESKERNSAQQKGLRYMKLESRGSAFESRARTGRPKKLNASQQRYLVLMIKRNPKMNWADILSNCPVPVAKNTLRQVLGKEWQRKLCSIKENSSG
ncbi:hypothetical protein N656DRAFT_780902 [Canariomyces notabilis]|uniref:Uncharacterized protein n=1 Tax=Canariomyces notabilis TaxID=2074819 RepID=A0AAN6YPJ0_9PEZI|nr:hypothetical protein N656DRAFT_780902 [Canariomyces arenarius]